MTFFQKIFDKFSNEIAIDLGTANTLVYAHRRGIILNEPSVVAVQKDPSSLRHKVLSVGREAKEMLGRTPGNIKAIRPIKDGVISDFEITSSMLKYFVSRAARHKTSLVRPRIVICVPYGVTQVEKKAVNEAAHEAGARDVYLLDEPMAAALGANLPIFEPKGSMVVDMGGGTTGVAVIALGGIVYCKSIRAAGDKMDESIVHYVRRKFNLLIGERTAENIKMTIGNALVSEDEGDGQIIEVKGRDLLAGAPKAIELTSAQVNEALTDPLQKIAEAVSITLEKTPPELAADLAETGIILTGGGALLKNSEAFLRKHTNLPVSVAEKPLDCVVLGAGSALNKIDLLKKLQTY